MMGDVSIEDRDIHDVSNVMSTAHRQERVLRLDVGIWFEQNNRSVGYGKQCVLAWSCVEKGIAV